MGQRKYVELHSRTARGWTKPSGAARYMDVSKKEVYRLIKAGELPFSTLENGEFRLAFDDMDLFLLNRKGKASDPGVQQLAEEMMEGLS